MQRRTALAALSAVIGAPLAASLCGSLIASCDDGGTSVGVEESKVLADWSQNVVGPLYASLGADVTALAAALDGLPATGVTVAQVEAAQTAWRAAQLSWDRARVVGFGPAKTVEANIRWNLGAEPSKIEETITAGPPFDPPTLGVTRKGLPALEYLLFEPAGGASAIQTKLAASGDRVAFLKALGANLKSEVDALVTAFAAHATELANAGAGSTVYKSPKDAVDVVYNQALYASDLAISIVATPIGGDTGPIAPDLEESRFSDNSLADCKAILDGVNAFFEGDLGGGAGLGLTDMLAERSPALDDQVRSSIAAAYAAVAAIPAPLRTALQGDRAVLDAALAALRGLKRVLTADVSTALGVTVSFSDMDGD